MDEAGLLNSMTAEQLKMTCYNLQRGCKDMEMLLSELQAEQALLRRERDRLHQKVEKVTAQAEGKAEDRGIIWSVVSEVDKRLEVSQLFKAKEERKAAKRRRWTRASHGSEQSMKVRGSKSRRDSAGSAAAENQGMEDAGLFSDAIVQMSWGNDMTQGTLRPNQWKTLEDQLERWVRDAMCGDPVAEAEALTDTNQVWNAQFGAATPEIARSSVREAASRSTGPTLDFSNPRRSPRHRSPAPGKSPPNTARRSTSRPEQPSSSPKSKGVSDGDFTDFGEALMSSFNREAGQMNARRDSAPLAYMTSFANAAADYVSNLLPAESATSRREESPPGIVSVIVHLRRSGVDRLWGFEWEKSKFRAWRDRVIDNLQAGSVAEGWNKDHVGIPEKQLRQGDRLVSANGRTSPEEITGELKGTEVVLEFHRVVARRAPRSPSRSPSPSPAPSSKPAATPATSTAPPSPTKAPRRAFQAAFTDYLKVVAPGSVAPAEPSSDVAKQPAVAEAKGEQDQSLVVQGGVEDEGVGVAPGKEADLGQDADPASRAAAELAALWALAEGGGNDEGEPGEGPGGAAPPPREAPYGVVAQVISLGTGSLRLSWLFDWASAPEEVSEQAWVERRFDITRRQEESGEEVRHGPCSQPLLDLELPVGHRYSFEVRAVLLDMRQDQGEDGGAADPRVLWTSASSSSVSADLRTLEEPLPTEPPAASGAPLPSSAASAPANGVAEAVGGGAASETAPGQTAAAAAAQFVPPPRRRGGVASSLGNFLAQRPNLAAPAAAGAEASLASRQPSPPSSPSRPNPVGAGPPDTTEEPPQLDSPTRGGAASSEAAAVVMGPFLDPMSTSNPRTSGARVLDPISEKQDVAEFLRMRRVGLRKEEPEVLRQRSSSFDSDDENSLMRLASALSSLERTAAAKLQDASTPAASSTAPGGETVAEEGHHSLHVRLDSGAQQTPVRPAGGSSKASAAAAAAAAAARDATPQSAAAAAAAFAARGFGTEITPVARPAQDSADDAGWANLADEDKATEGGGFRLVVQVSDGKAPALQWRAGEDLATLVQRFVAEHKIKDLFEEPIVKRAAAMEQAGTREDCVDIVELIE